MDYCEVHKLARFVHHTSTVVFLFSGVRFERRNEAGRRVFGEQGPPRYDMVHCTATHLCMMMMVTALLCFVALSFVCVLSKRTCSRFGNIGQDTCLVQSSVERSVLGRYYIQVLI